MIDQLLNDIPFLVSIIFNIIGWLLAIILYFRSKRKPDLRYEILTSNRLLSDSEELEGKVKIYFKDEIVKDVHLLIIRLINDGNMAILNNHYQEPLKLSFSDKSTILSSTIIV